MTLTSWPHRKTFICIQNIYKHILLITNQSLRSYLPRHLLTIPPRPDQVLMFLLSNHSYQQTYYHWISAHVLVILQTKDFYIIFIRLYELRHDKTNIMGLWPAWIQTSLRIRPVWSVSMLFAISFFTCYRVC
jgi:hypothetical protein